MARLPTLILVGECDMPDVHAHCGAIEAGIRNARRIVVPGAAHFVQPGRPDETNSSPILFPVPAS